MSMPFNYQHFLLNLPVDALLTTFLTGKALSLPKLTGMEETAAKALILERIEQADDGIRDSIIADLREACALASKEGREEVLNVCHGNAAVLDTFEQLETDEQRALWLYMTHPDLFETAEEAKWFADTPRNFAPARDLKVKRAVDRSDDARFAMASAMSAFYLNKERCGQSCKVFIIDRKREGTVQVTVYVQDHANNSTEFIKGNLERRPSTPARHMAIVYSEAKGIARTIVKGGKDYHEALINIFAEHMLHTAVNAERIRPTPYELANLKQRLAIPSDLGINTVRLKEVVLIDEETGGELIVRAPARETDISVHDLIERWMPTDNPLKKQLFKIVAAKINLHYFPEVGKKPRPVITLHLKRRGGTNIEDFDEALRVKLESYLVGWDILEATGTFSASEGDEIEEITEPTA